MARWKVSRSTCRWRYGIPLSIFALVLVPVLAAAQGRAEGSINGRVVDDTGAVLPGATVTAINAATGFTRTAVTGGEGNYVLPLLPPGQYALTAELNGFGRFERTVTVTVGSDQTLVIALSVASLQETLTVTGEAPLIEVTSTQQSTTVNEIEVRSLPIATRSFTEYAALAPGVVQSGASFSVGGQRTNNNALNIDGLENRSYDDNAQSGNFSSEAVQEFEVITQGANAEYGQNTGSVLNAVTKSGTNTFTGYGFYFLRDDAFFKPPFETFTEPSGRVRAVASAGASEFRNQVYGLTLGGPIAQNKAFFFGVIDRESTSEPTVRTILPSTLEIVRPFLPLMPDNDSNRVVQNTPRELKMSAKVDYNMSQRHNMSFRASTASAYAPAVVNGRNSRYGGSESDDMFYLVSASVNSILTDRRLNTVRFNFFHRGEKDAWPHRGGLESIASMDPAFVISGNTGGTFGAGNRGSMTPTRFERRFEVQDTVQIHFDQHTMKTGFGWQHVPSFTNFMRYTLGEWMFSDLNAFVAGRPAIYIQSFGPAATYMKTNFLSLYAQDEWRLRTNLTINYGVRWEYNQHPSDVTNFELPYAVINTETGRFDVTRNGSSYVGGFESQTGNLMPRLGVSWSPDGGSTVMRASAGRYYGLLQLSALTQGVMWSGDQFADLNFTAAQAERLWRMLQDRTSPIYNNGQLRVKNSQKDLAMAIFGLKSTLQPAPSAPKEPYTNQATLAIERQVTPWLAGSLSYTYSRGYDNVRNANLNLQASTFSPQGALLPSGTVAAFDTWYAGGARLDSRFDNINTYVQEGTIKYRGLAAGLTARWTGLTLRANYTGNRTYDDAVTTNVLQQPAHQTNPNCGRLGGDCEWAVSNLSRKHQLVTSGTVTLPQQWHVLGRDWQVGTIVSLRSGAPVTVNAGFDFNNDVVLTDRPLGVPRNALWSHANYDVDLRLARTVRLGGRRSVELMFDMFNVFNTANPTGYVTTLYRFSGGRYIPRDDFAAFHDSGKLNDLNLDRSPEEIGLDRDTRVSGYASAFQGQLGLRLRF